MVGPHEQRWEIRELVRCGYRSGYAFQVIIEGIEGRKSSGHTASRGAYPELLVDFLWPSHGLISELRLPPRPRTCDGFIGLFLSFYSSSMGLCKA